MDTRIATTFAFRNLKANKILYIPFIISTRIIVDLFNIALGKEDCCQLFFQAGRNEKQ